MRVVLAVGTPQCEGHDALERIRRERKCGLELDGAARVLWDKRGVPETGRQHRQAEGVIPEERVAVAAVALVGVPAADGEIELLEAGATRGIRRRPAERGDRGPGPRDRPDTDRDAGL